MEPSRSCNAPSLDRSHIEPWNAIVPHRLIVGSPPPHLTSTSSQPHLSSFPHHNATRSIREPPRARRATLHHSQRSWPPRLLLDPSLNYHHIGNPRESHAIPEPKSNYHKQKLHRIKPLTKNQTVSTPLLSGPCQKTHKSQTSRRAPKTKTGPVSRPIPRFTDYVFPTGESVP